ncbi:unnamed protein product [Boreogadus saida]
MSANMKSGTKRMTKRMTWLSLERNKGVAAKYFSYSLDQLNGKAIESEMSFYREHDARVAMVAPHGFHRRVPQTGSTDGFHRRVPQTGSTDGFHRPVPQTGSTDRFHRPVPQTGSTPSGTVPPLDDPRTAISHEEEQNDNDT